MKQHHSSWIRSTLTILVSVILAVGILRIVSAGSLSPSASPAATLKTLDEIYNPLVSTTYDSSAVTASASGDALEIAKCIIARIGGSSCP